MAAATSVKTGGLVTSTAAEIQIQFTDLPIGAAVSVLTELVSGSVQYGVYENTTAFVPQIDASQETVSTAGSKRMFDIQNGIFNLRCKGSGTFSVTHVK